MASAWRSLEKRLPAIAFLLELRDARLPLSGTNPRLHNVAKHGTVVLLTKSDLTSASLVERAVATLARSGTMALPINAHARPAAAANVVVKAIRDLSLQQQLAGRVNVLVAGLPNVGKSTLVNALRTRSTAAASSSFQRASAHVGDKPGVTRQLSSFQILAQPPIYVVDTPGLMLPSNIDSELGLALALVDCVPESQVPSEVLVHFLLHSLNQRNAAAAYQSLYAMSAPTDDPQQLVDAVVRRLRRSGDTAHEWARRRIIADFRQGKLGHICFDQVPIAPGFIVHKLLSVNPTQYEDAPTEGIRVILERVTGVAIARGAPIPCERIESIRMGTTVATNALLERKGVKTMLVTTAGFRDILAIGNQARPAIFDLHIRKPELIYDEVYEVAERVRVVPPDAVHVLQAPDVDAARGAFEAARARGIDSVAIVLMHAYAHPAHELALGAVARACGFRHVSLSHDTVGSIRIVQRGFTTSVDAYLTPLVHEYVRTFKRGFANLEHVALSFMASDGGLCPVAEFNGYRSLLSGPAGGVVGLAKTAFDGRRPVIGFDMGGTSTDVSRFDGDYHHIFETQIAGVHVLAPQLEISTVAAGGGSRLYFRAGMFLVGPESAGALPGPACYGRGGPLAVTDANLLLGRLQPQHFPRVFGASGAEPLSREAARALFERELLPAIAAFQPMSLEEAALGFVRVANEAMCRPIRALMQRYGLAAATHTLGAFGSAGPQHACAIARALGVPRVEIHRHCGVLSAFGIGLADSVREAQRVVALAYDASAAASWDAAFDEMAAPLRDSIAREGIGAARIAVQRFLNLRYRGSDTAIMIARPDDLDYAAAFVVAHRQQYGFLLHNRPLEIDHVRVRVVGKSDVNGDDSNDEIGDDDDAHQSAAAPIETVRCYFDDGAGWLETPVYELAQLRVGTRLRGPCHVLLQTSTAVIEPRCEARVTASGNLRVAIDVAAAAATAGVECDLIQMSVFSHRFMAIAEQMGYMLRRTAISVNIKERLDFSCALFSADGSLVANAPHLPVHLGAMSDAVRWQIAHLGAEWRDGDVVMSNHPEAGGSHLPDITVITAVFHGGKPVFFVASRGHHADVGGISPGSVPPHSKTLAEEGVGFLSARIVRDGQFDDDGVTKLLTTPPAPGIPGTRCLHDCLSDLKAMVAANNRGILLVKQLIDEYSLPVVHAYMAHVQRAAADAVRAMLGAIAARVAAERGEPDARRVVVQSTDHMDCGAPIALRLTIDRDTNSAHFDFAGTGAQVIGNINAPRAVAYSAIIYSLRALVKEEIPLNAGCLEPVTIDIPRNSLLWPSVDAAVVGGNVLTSQRVTDVVLAAFGALANSMGDMSNLTFGDESSAYYETIGGGAGAGRTFDGASGVQCHMTNTKLTDPEIVERRFPVLVRRFELRHGSGGDGEFRGGDGLVREIEFLKPMTVSILSERRSLAPHGANGGGDGARGLNLLHRPDGSTINITGSMSLNVAANTRIEIRTPGGGGFGAPKQQQQSKV